MLLLIGLVLGLSLSAPAQWTPTRGAKRQLVITFTVKDSIIFAGVSAGPYPDTTYIGGALRSTDYGATWVKIDSGFFTGTVFPLTVYSLIVVGQSLFAGTSNGVFISSNDGATWMQASTGIDSDEGSRNVQALVFSGSNLFAGTENGVFYSSNRGANWSRRDSGLGSSNENVLSMAYMGSTLLAGVNDNGIYISTDTGKSWSNPSMVGNSTMSFAKLDSTLFAGGGGIRASIDEGNTWTFLKSSPKDTLDNGYLTIESLAAVGRCLLAGTDFYGIFLSSDRGNSWNAVNDGLNGFLDLTVWSITTAGQNLIIGTATNIWRRPLSEVITQVQNDRPATTKQFSLKQNYPNPFNPLTVIEYDLPSYSFVSLKLFDVLGREIETLVNSYQSPQHYAVRFDASRLASGVYLYRIAAGRFVSTKKLLLIK